MILRNFRIKIFKKLASQDENYVRDIYDLVGDKINAFDLGKKILLKIKDQPNKDKLVDQILLFILQSFNRMVGQYINNNLNISILNNYNKMEIDQPIFILLHDLIHETLKPGSIKIFEERDVEFGTEPGQYSLEELLEEDMATAPSFSSDSVSNLRFGIHKFVKDLLEKLRKQTGNHDQFKTRDPEKLLEYGKVYFEQAHQLISSQIRHETFDMANKSRAKFIKTIIDKALNKAWAGRDKILNKSLESKYSIEYNIIYDLILKEILEILEQKFYQPDLGMTKQLGLKERNISLLRRWVRYLDNIFTKPIEEILMLINN